MNTEDQKRNVLELTRQLVRIPSPTGSENQVTEFLETFLKEMGFTVLSQEVGAGRSNLLALNGEPKVVLCTHTDTVSPFLQPGEDDRYIYGRGACDTRGIIAAMLMAGADMVQRGTRDFGILFLVGEEGPHDGAKKANMWEFSDRCRYLINGEPTENKMAHASLGGMLVTLKTKGIARHSGMPRRGRSAVHELLNILDDLRKVSLPKEGVLGQASLNVGRIWGGIQANIMAPEAGCDLLFRLVNEPERYIEIIRETVSGRAEIEILSKYPPVTLRTLPGFPSVVAPFGTDIPFLNRWGEPLLIGPGSISDAHSPEEKVEKSQVRDAVHIYVRMVERLLEAPGS